MRLEFTVKGGKIEGFGVNTRGKRCSEKGWKVPRDTHPTKTPKSGPSSYGFSAGGGEARDPKR
jgi:hypothetical protein